jgi:CheY-like chemotaxis protein
MTMVDCCVVVGDRTAWPPGPEAALSRGLTEPACPFGSAPPVDIASSPSTPKRGQEEGPTTKPCVLLVEDNPGALETFAAFFRAAEFDVRLAATGAAGLMAVRAGVHLVVADLCLPDLSGLELLEQIGALGLRVPFIMVSGHGTPELKKTAVDAGAVAFLTKPVDGDALVRTARLAIQSERTVPRRAVAAASFPTVGPMRPRSEAMAEITGLVAALTATVKSRASTDVRQRLAKALAETLVRPDLAICELLACAKALRQVATATSETSPAELVERAMDALAEAHTPRTGGPYHAKVVAALARLASPDATGLCVSEDDLGREIGISGSHLGRLLRVQTGLAFRDWRRGFRMRHATQRLAAIDDDVYQIADSLGYRHASRFDDEFRDTFGLSPRAFRATFRARARLC